MVKLGHASGRAQAVVGATDFAFLQHAQLLEVFFSTLNRLRSSLGTPASVTRSWWAPQTPLLIALSLSDLRPRRLSETPQAAWPAAWGAWLAGGDPIITGWAPVNSPQRALGGGRAGPLTAPRVASAEGWERSPRIAGWAPVRSLQRALGGGRAGRLSAPTRSGGRNHPSQSPRCHTSEARSAHS